jgi:hypothetical protein
MDVMDQLKKSTKGVEKALAPIFGNPDDHDILDTLKKEHDEVRALLEQLVKSEQPATRKKLLKQVEQALVPHTKAEEKIVYERLLSFKEKNAKIDGEEGFAEHNLADLTLAKLGKISNTMSPEFSAHAKVLKELIEHHVEEEERNVWKDVREHCDADERIEMNKKFELAKKKVKV